MQRTIKLPIKLNKEEFDIVLNYQKNYNNVLRFSYNRICDNPKITTKEITILQKELNNIFIDSHFKNSAFQEAKAIYKTMGDEVVFGGRHLFNLRQSNKISKEEFVTKRLNPLYSVGEAISKGNRKFSIKSENIILFKPCKSIHINIALPKLSKNLLKDLKALKILQNERQGPITYKLTTENIYISFDNNTINKEEKIKPIENRIMSVDLNPNYIGYSVLDWKDTYKILDKGVISIKQINDKDNKLKGKASDNPLKIRINNKRRHEIIEVASQLVKIAKHYKCELFALEDLKIRARDNNIGKRFNRLVNNQWLRNLLTYQIEKRCDKIGIKIQKINPAYSSVLGNILYRSENLPDMILSSIEISRRANEFNLQYIKKIKPLKKTIILPEFNSNKLKVIKSLEELNYFEEIKNWQDLFNKLKTLKIKYRVPFDYITSIGFSLKHKKSMLILSKFNDIL